MADKDRQSSEMEKPEFTELDWITLKQDINSATLAGQGPSESKFVKKFKENPFVPIGCGLTAAALCFGLYSFTQGKNRLSQKMMRMRIAAQGFTIAALMIGIVKASMS
ncbi:HIG1 domain member 2A [Halocaridina rubra]|uniref:HIG1 domain member 2A n=1 Tax=Halocaridina rubra TaxID=373956 RepID=A0AAN9A6P7_HALRR